MTGKGLVNGIEVEFNISEECKNLNFEDLVVGKGIWLKFVDRGINTVIEFIGNDQKYSEKSFDVYYKAYRLFADGTVCSEFYNKIRITDEAEFDGFFSLSENGLLYPHITFKSPLNGICLAFLGDRLFDSYTGVILNEVIGG